MGAVNFSYCNGRYESEEVLVAEAKAIVRVEFSGECSAVVVERRKVGGNKYVAAKRLMNGSRLPVVEDGLHRLVPDEQYIRVVTTAEPSVIEVEFVGSGGGGGGGTTNYNELTNLPKINGVTVKGNITTADLGLSLISIEVVATLPATGETNKIYLVLKTGEGNDVHDEYIYVNNAWELIGSTQIENAQSISNNEIDTICM